MESACKKNFALFIFLLLAIANASGQPRGKVEYYSTEHGLSHQRVTTILKDKEGFMWFGSWDGINRFDGNSFVSYKSSPGDRFQLGNDRIDQIIEDQSDHLWLAAYDKQIYRFNKKTGDFLPLSTLFNPPDGHKIAFNRILAANNGSVWLESVDEGIVCVPQTNLSNTNIIAYKNGLTADFNLPSNTINFFHEDAEHRIWIGTPEGLCCLVRSANGIYKNNRISSPEVAKLNCTDFEEDSSHLYFSTANGNLIFYNKSFKSFFVVKASDSRLNALIKSSKNDVIYATSAGGELISVNIKDQEVNRFRYQTGEPLFSLFEDSQRQVWVEPEKEGAICFKPADHAFKYFSQKNEEGFNYIGNRFRILEDHNGIVWVNMKRGGFGYYNQVRDEIDNLLATPDANSYRLPKLVYTINYDSSGILWFTTYERELVKVILQRNDFKQQLLVDQGVSISDNEVRGILYDNKNRLWVGAKSGKMHVFQNGKRLTNLFENEPAEGLGLVYSILQDSRGNIWLGTKGNGLFRASPVGSEGSKYQLTHFRTDKSDPRSLWCNEIYGMLEDQRNRIWLGSFDRGLTLVNDNGQSTTFIHTGNAFHNYPKGAFNRIRHMALDHQGNIWIGTTDGLLILNPNGHDPSRYTYKAYSKIPGDKESLGNNDVQFIYRDSKGRMWLATSGGGFCQAISSQPFQSLRFRNYTTKDGLPNNYVLSCAEDGRGNLWIATENGLTKFNPETNVFRNYDSYDGLPKASFSEAAVSRQLANGQFVFGTTKGFLSFNPNAISNKPITANIALTNLQINNQDALPGMNEVGLKSNISYESGLTLEYDQNIISIDYAILDHRAGNRQAFAYRLIGFDTTWHDDRQLRRATYTNLRPGNYLFEVKSLSSDLYTNQPYRSLAIKILPPPWKTWWAYLLYAIIIGVLLFFIRRTALAMIRLRNKIAVEQKLAALKLNFFTNVSHELRTPLTLIISPLEQLSKKEKLSPESTSYLDVARKNAARMVRFINQLLDLRKVQSDKATLRISRVEVVTFVKKISDHFTEAAKNKRIKLDISADQKELIAWVDAEKLDVVVYNLLGNAVKFTPDGKAINVIIRSFPAEDSFSIEVRDQGPGVQKEKLEEIFELFHEGDPYAAGEMKGSGIGLALSKELVNLHGGRIWASNNEDGGLTVTLKLKLGTDHYKPAETLFVESPSIPAAHETPIEQQLLTLSSEMAPKDHQAPLVLLVEDNDELRTFLKGQLLEFYRVETARDGQEGFEKALNLMPDLIVSDIMMPVLDGIQMLDKVKNDVNTSHIPVVLLSAKYSIESQIQGLQYGADYYITKPFNNEFLIASIDNLLRQRKKLFESLVQKKKTIDLGPEPIVVTSKDESFLKDVIRVVEDKMSDTEFNIDTVAESMAMGRTTFYKKFKSLTGLAPVEFVRDFRLQRAKQYLDAGGSNISEVAYLVGFSNPKYFSTCFKEKYHVSPSDYQKTKTALKNQY